MAKKEKSQKGKRIVLGIICALLAIVLVVMVGATILVDSVLGNVNYVEKGQDATLSYEDALALKEQASTEASTEATAENPTEEGPAEEEPTGESTEEEPSEEDVTQEVDIPDKIGEEKHITNILLIGQDSQKGVRERSDTMMLVTVNTEKDTITITSFMRDMYVKIPGYYKTKINEAYVLGGMDLLNETLKENFGIVVDHNVEVSFGQFTEIIDYLDGVDLELTKQEAQFVNNAIGVKNAMVEGMNHLDGNSALVYARYRDKATGDFGRTERQRKTMNAIIDKYKSSNLTTMIGMVNEMMGMITTNMTKAEILGYAVKFFPMLSSAEIVSQRVPFDGKHTNGRDYYVMDMKDGISVVVPRLPENVEKLAETLS